MAMNGIEIYGNVPLSVWATSITRPSSEPPAYPREASTRSTKADECEKVTIRDYFGGRLIWNTPLNGLRVRRQLSIRPGFPGDRRYNASVDRAIAMLGGLSMYPAGTQVTHDAREITMWYAFGEFTFRKLVLAGEFTQLSMSGDLDTSEPFDPFVAALAGFTGLPPQRVNRGGWYGQANYQVFKWATVAATYGEFYTDIDDRKGHNYKPNWSGYQKDVTISLRFDINQYGT